MGTGLSSEASGSARLCYSKDEEPNLTRSLSGGAACKPESLGSEPELRFLLHIHSPFCESLENSEAFTL